MGKNMAKLHKGVVINIEWYSNDAPETDLLKNMDERPVDIGDIYENGKFYRKGIEILTPFEEMQKSLMELENKQNELITSYNEGVNSI